MAIGTNLPPQAYTRDTLTQAFTWLQSQPESVRRSATTPESLVSLYQRNQRFGPEAPRSSAPISPLAGDDFDELSSPSEAPISAQNFKTDLKTLAEGLKQFEDPKSFRTSTHQVTQSTQQVLHQASQQALHQASQQVAQPVQQPAQQQLRALPAAVFTVESLNQASREMVQEVKHSLNLSSDLEAINMMVAIAYKNLKTLLA